MEVIRMARDLGKAIQATEEYSDLIAAKTANDADEHLHELIGAFNLKKIEVETMMQQKDQDEDKLSKKNAEMQKLYGEIMANENMIAYDTAMQKVQKLMNHVNTILAEAFNGGDPENCDLEPVAGCGGNCSGCSGCH